MNIDKLVFLDESSINLAFTRLYGRAYSNERINEGRPDVRFQRESILSTVRLNGEKCPIIFEGTLNKEIFSEYLEKQLAPTLGEDDIVIMDNCSVHKSKMVLETLKRCRINVLFLPPYSPDYNPIELMWTKVKAYLKKVKARTIETLEKAISEALLLITNEDILNWFKHDGYTTTKS